MYMWVCTYMQECLSVLSLYKMLTSIKSKCDFQWKLGSLRRGLGTHTETEEERGRERRQATSSVALLNK